MASTTLKQSFGLFIAILGIVFTILVFIITLYLDNYNLEIVHGNVYEFAVPKDPLPGIQIYHGDKNLTELDVSLFAVEVIVHNKGQAITQDRYDELSNFGVNITGANILRARLLSTNLFDTRNKQVINAIRKLNTVPKDSFESFIELPKIILDRNDYYALELILLGPSEATLSFDMQGKIASITSLEINEGDTFSIKNKTPLSKTIQTVLYTSIIIILGLVIVSLLISFIYIIFALGLSELKVYRRYKSIRKDTRSLIDYSLFRAIAHNKILFAELLGGRKVAVDEMPNERDIASIERGSTEHLKLVNINDETFSINEKYREYIAAIASILNIEQIKLIQPESDIKDGKK